MPERTSPTASSEKSKRPIQIFRERRRGVPRQLVERNRMRRALQKRIVEALRSEPSTVPELARKLGHPSDEVFWQVMAMKKYGEIAEAEQDGSYFEYRLVDEPRQTETPS